MISTTIDWAFLPIYIFMENKGKQLWTCDESETEILQHILPNNGFVVNKSWKETDTLFVQIDSKATDLKNFYSFEEVTQKKGKGTEDCWRRFFVFLCKRESEKHLESFWLGNIESEFTRVLHSISKKDECFKEF